MIATIHNQKSQIPSIGSIPTIKPKYQPRDLSSDIKAATSESEYEDVKIEGVLVDEVTVPKLDGTRGSALYAIPFKLSRTPSDLWKKLFVEAWNHPSEWTSMHRPGIASIRVNKILLDGTTIEGVEKYHRKTLKLAVNAANTKERAWLIKKHNDEERERQKIKNHYDGVRDAANRITFD
mgnify:CR=1 FL=1